MKTVKTHINDLEVGDKVLMFGALVATITGYEITGKGYQRIYGYYGNDVNDLGLIESCNCELDKVIESEE